MQTKPLDLRLRRLSSALISDVETDAALEPFRPSRMQFHLDLTPDAKRGYDASDSQKGGFFTLRHHGFRSPR
ncbi:MAG: hypothetical protein Kow0047_17830 [Anaerolineae bacterium]